MSRQAEAPAEWASYHIFYHEPGDRVLLRLVLPLLRELRRRGRISRFFFIRYGEGGPHVRLRLLHAPRHRERIDAGVRRAAARFFARWPARPLSDDDADRQAWYLLVNDARSDVAHPNNSVAEIPFEPEVERYGGGALIEPSLDFFHASSACVLHLLARHPGLDKPRRLGLGLRLLWRQALGFAAHRQEIAELVAYATPEQRSPLAERADREFEARADHYVRLLWELLREAIAGLQAAESDPGIADGLLTAAARRLRQQVAGAGEEARWRILGSQLHMTANRLGLLKPEEVYLGRILWRALQRAEAEGSPWPGLEPFLAAPALLEPDALESRVAASLARGREGDRR
ncbi:MAG TPA: thiopeptide-type bacteriocin biosynthesis protein [Thermoanaerobaculia bacterium]|jgi:thiopeptide-type bacteriocin biosynthesis protein